MRNPNRVHRDSTNKRAALPRKTAAKAVNGCAAPPQKIAALRNAIIQRLGARAGFERISVLSLATEHLNELITASLVSVGASIIVFVSAATLDKITVTVRVCTDDLINRSERGTRESVKQLASRVSAALSCWQPSIEGCGAVSSGEVLNVRLASKSKFTENTAAEVRVCDVQFAVPCPLAPAPQNEDYRQRLITLLGISAASTDAEINAALAALPSQAGLTVHLDPPGTEELQRMASASQTVSKCKQLQAACALLSAPSLATSRRSLPPVPANRCSGRADSHDQHLQRTPRRRVNTRRRGACL